MPGKSFASLCVKCKGGKKLCGLGKCPILERVKSHVNIYKYVESERFDGATPPSLLVGEYGYPKVRVMLNVPPGRYGSDAVIYDAPILWWGKLGLEDIIRLRSSMVASTTIVDIKDPWRLYEREINIAAVSAKPVESEIRLVSKPKVRVVFNGLTKPVALTGLAEDIKITSNPYVGGLLEKRIFDDVKAAETIRELYLSGYDVYTLIHALSGGLLGEKKNRKIVPTRWAITAVDSTLGDYFRRKILEYEYVDKVYAYTGEYLGNRFLVVIYPGSLEFEWMEAWHGRGLWTPFTKRVSIFRVYEDPWGRFDYMDGGFMAARLPVLEHLYRMRRQGGVLIYREILPTYYAPVGNWHIRETVRRMLTKIPRKYDDLSEALNRELSFFTIDKKYWLRKSKVVGRLHRQMKLSDFL